MVIYLYPLTLHIFIFVRKVAEFYFTSSALIFMEIINKFILSNAFFHYILGKFFHILTDSVEKPLDKTIHEFLLPKKIPYIHIYIYVLLFYY